MNWIEIKSEDYHPIQCMDGIGNVHHLMFSPVEIDKEPTEEEPNPGDTKVIFVRTEEAPNVEKVRNILSNLIKEYDKSNEVNYFNYKNYRYWFDREERLALTHKFQVLHDMGKTTGLIWFGSVSYEVDVAMMLDFLEGLEYYAIRCNDVTRQHLNDIKSINTIEDLIMYDITADYPQSVTINPNTFKE